MTLPEFICSNAAGAHVKKIKMKLHFGIQRTGSTTVQRCLVANSELLKKNGYLYPLLGVNFRHNGLAWQLNNKKVSIENIIDRIEAEVTPVTHTVILSGEDFALVKDYAWLETLTKKYDVEIAMYLKRQDLWLESWYNQHVKWPWSKKFSNQDVDFFYKNINDFPWIDFESLLSRITKHIPQKSLHLAVVDGLGVKDTAADFLAFCDISADLVQSASEKNASLSMAQIDILRRIDLYSLPGKSRQKIIKTLVELDIEEDDKKKIVFDDEQVSAILNRFEKSNQRVAKKYFNRAVLFSDPVTLERKPVRISDEKAYKVYLPMLIRNLANSK